MAELLVKAIDAVCTDPGKSPAELAAKDARGCYKRGDVVVVMPDGHAWGAMEGPPKFWVVKVPGLSVEAAQAYLERSETRRRALGVAWADVPNGVKNQLQSSGAVTVTVQQVGNFVKRKD